MNHKNQLVKNTVIIAIGKHRYTGFTIYIYCHYILPKMATGEYGTYDFILLCLDFYVH